jgi:predicted CXXCH cytochrome family protein
MKKLVIALALGIVLVAAFATLALADNGPHGGNAFASGNTDACASCHRAHTAQSTDGFLLKSGSIYGLCTSCHDGTGAYTNVVYGIYDTSAKSYTYADPGEGESGVGLLAGGFSYTTMSHTWTGKSYYDTAVAPVSAAVTSGHVVNSATAYTVWGAGAYGSGANAGSGTMALDCTDCHDPHGYAGKDATGKSIPSYRLLRYNPTGSNGYQPSSASLFTNINSGALDVVAGTTGGATVLEPAGMGAVIGNGYKATRWWYTINTDWTKDPFLAALKKPFAGTYWESVTFGKGDYGPYGRGATYKRPAAANSTSYFCYDPTGGAPANPPSINNNCTTAPSGTLFDNSKARIGLGLFCAQCHDRYLAASASRTTDSGDTLYMFRHIAGAASAATGSDASVTCVDCHNSHGTSAVADALAASAALSTDSALLKLDNRSMCARCHANDVNFQFTP